MFFKSKWNDKKEAEYIELRNETRQNVIPIIKDCVFEIEAHRQIATKTDLWTDREYKEMVQDMLDEAIKHFEDMDPREILDDLTERKLKKLGAKVIKVEI